MAEKIPIKAQRTVTDLDTMDEVTLIQEGEFTPVESQAEALSRVGNDASKYLALVNEGLKAEAQRELRSATTGWHSLDDEGAVNGEFTGTIADPQKVNQLALTLAKTVFGYSKDLGAEQKRAAKEAARDMIKNTPVIREGLKSNAALVAE